LFSFIYFFFVFFFFFFFQAEDGIRDFHVTGVQTCALPICSYLKPYFSFIIKYLLSAFVENFNKLPFSICSFLPSTYKIAFPFHRSEERRVGKECRSWLSLYN